MIAVIAELLDHSPTTSRTCPAQAAAGTPNCLMSPGRHDPAVERAKAVCASCPVLGDCRRWLARRGRRLRVAVGLRGVASPPLRRRFGGPTGRVRIAGSHEISVDRGRVERTHPSSYASREVRPLLVPLKEGIPRERPNKFMAACPTSDAGQPGEGSLPGSVLLRYGESDERQHQ
jgi:hypothetical protein